MDDIATITLVQGKLRGKQVTTKDGNNYYSFQGIPYAKPPVGSLRFKPPEPAEPWVGVRDALKEGSVASQIDRILGSGYIGSEDCLFLNVYTTKLPKAEDTLKPVMVCVHGGGYFIGSGNTDLYGPDYLMTGDVVLVTFNYRLGPIGACHGDDGGYVFHMAHHDKLNLDPEDDAIKVKNKMVKLWTNFAKTGNPTPDNDPELGVKWKPINKTDLGYLNIDKDLTIQKAVDEKQLAFWKEIFAAL